MRRCLFLLPLLAVTSAVAQPMTDSSFVAEPVWLEAPTGTVYGTLLLPEGAGPHPAALLIAGSGPTDRDGNTMGLPGKNNSLRYLAEALAGCGVATVRYDKRGIGESQAAAPSEADLRFETYVDDAAAWIRQLQADPRFASVAVVGHSEGSLIGMLAAEQAGAARLVSLAGLARPAPEVLRDQLRPRLPVELWQASERILETLEAGQTTAAEDVPPALLMLYRPSVQPYLISWFRHHPTAIVARLTLPILLVQGTTDIQVDVEEAEALHRAQPEARLALIEGMNHVLKAVPGDLAQQQSSYFDPALPLAPGLADEVCEFLN